MPYFEFEGKQIYYDEKGEGKPVIFLHGNVASSKIFEFILSLYRQFRVITMDFLGYGMSDRMDQLPADLWIWQSKQVISLIQHLNVEKVCLVGTSGGAWVAINTALERPDLVERVVADSFDGRESLDAAFSDNLRRERQAMKDNENAWWFYSWCQGQDWEEVLEKDTQALLACAEQGLSLFTHPISELRVPLLLTGSRQDEMAASLEDAWEAIRQQVPQVQTCLLDEGEHPSIITNAAECARVIGTFLQD